MKKNMKTVLGLTFVTVGLVACGQVSKTGGSEVASENPAPTSVKLDVVTSSSTMSRYEGDEVIVQVGEINKSRAAIFDLKKEQKTIGLIQLKPAQSGEEAIAQCAALGNSWRMLEPEDFLAILMTGNPGEIYNTMLPFPNHDGSLIYPAWLKVDENKSELRVMADGIGLDLLTLEDIAARINDSVKAEQFKVTALKQATVYCISGQLFDK